MSQSCEWSRINEGRGLRLCLGGMGFDDKMMAIAIMDHLVDQIKEVGYVLLDF